MTLFRILLMPAKDKPYHRGGKQRGERIDLRLNGIEPEAVGKGKGKGTDGGATEGRDGLSPVPFIPGSCAIEAIRRTMIR